MFSCLKESIRREMHSQSTDDLMLESNSMYDVKNLFVDTDSVDENDSELMSILDKIPEDSEDDDIEHLTESLMI